MKQSAFCFFAFLLCLFTAHAQHAGGKAVIGGTINHANHVTKIKDANTGESFKYQLRQTSLNPYIGFWLGEHWMMGTQGGINYVKRTQYFQSISEYVDYTGKEYSIGLFARKYFGSENPIRFFLESGVIYTSSSNKSSTDQITFGIIKSYKQTSVYLSPGVAWAITKRFNLLGRFGRLNYVSGKRQPYYNAAEMPYRYFDIRMNAATFFIGAEYRL